MAVEVVVVTTVVQQDFSQEEVAAAAMSFHLQITFKALTAQHGVPTLQINTGT